MNLKLLSVLAGAVVLAGCSGDAQRQASVPTMSAPPPQQQQRQAMVWVRTDGQRGSGDPQLQQEYQQDTNACPGAAQMAPEAQECMGQRGYILVPESDAEETLRLFAQQRGQG